MAIYEFSTADKPPRFRCACGRFMLTEAVDGKWYARCRQCKRIVRFGRDTGSKIKCFMYGGDSYTMEVPSKKEICLLISYGEEP